MRTSIYRSISCVIVFAAGAAHAADLPVKAAPLPPPVLWTWTGFYVGAHVGGGSGTTKFDDPFGASIYGDSVRTPKALAGLQAGYNWQAPGSNIVLGVEADASVVDSNGTQTCLAFSGYFLSANCRVRQDFTGSLTGRVGLAVGNGGHTLLYAKGGAAFLSDRKDITINPLGDPRVTSLNETRLGWTVGGGVEHAITPAWSVKLEYDYADFGRPTIGVPSSFIQAAPPLPLYFTTAATTTRVSQDIHLFKLGLNYRIDGDATARWDSVAPARIAKAAPLAWSPGWTVEVGGRYWYSSGRFQKDLGATFNQNQQTTLNSRLTYDSKANSGELFGRVDSPYDVFVKGFIGGGKLVNGGELTDEDWLLGGGTVPYSNTLSSVKGDITYGTVDLGYNVLSGPGYKVGGFVGYNYYRENKSGYGCIQFANPNAGCIPAIPTSVLVITEDDKWQSLRVGATAEMMLGYGFKLTGDAAYLPYVSVKGVDNHVLRNLVSPETGHGQGVQLEAILSYYVTPNFSIGAGGRYWAMWATKDAYTNFGGAPCPCQPLPMRTERYGTFLQASYTFNPPPPPVTAKY
ncbi:MAG: outer membrane beta-barrel protein [Rhodopseudomonas palustris]|uniref:Outer membrane beta-barrel protein n=1 Tax=Rhodopseudomonas palustris TaxID=1076 RepID=A0A933VVQ7_RHOPL|nr:outer membrane beta-barrel protein [Rhodopseudomonas palustris]